MFKILLYLLVISFVLSSPSFANIEINNQEIVDDLIVIQNEIDTISSAIMSCMDSGKQHKECMCDNKEKLVNFAKTAQALFDEHPELKGLDLIHYRNQDGTINNQSLLGIKKQASMELSCD
jgi:hypothetical protein